MEDHSEIEEALEDVMLAYTSAFSAKVYVEESDERDVLMDAFGITPDLKRENRQYWGRELGMCWQRLVTTLYRARCAGFSPAIKVGADEPCDFVVDSDAVDTKYRVGSGDAGTLKKFVAYGELLASMGLRPVLLFVRSDNLGAAIAACRRGGWSVYTDSDTFEYIRDHTGFDLKGWLVSAARHGEYTISR